MKLTVFLLCCFLCMHSYKLKAQTSGEMALYNVSLGAVVSGVGALINKDKHEKWNKVLLKGMTQGALGGYLVYQSKKLLTRLTTEQKWRYSWYAKFVNAAGTSIIENATLNQNFWEKWHLNFGFNRFELYTKDGFKVKYKIMPVAFLFTVSVATRGNFEWKRTLQTGEFIFSQSETSGRNRGRAYGSTILVRKPFFNDYDLYAHEFTHIYQYYDFNFVNTYVNKPFSKWKEKSKTFSKINRLFYIDLNGALLYPAYFLQEGYGNANFFEREADFFEH